MRGFYLLLVMALSGCDIAPPGAMLAVDAASVMVFGRGLTDIGVSAVTGRDCSIVRLDRGFSYCAANEAPPPQAYCTRTLATVDCWATANNAPGVGDTPPPSAAQERWRAASWPKSLLARP